MLYDTILLLTIVSAIVIGVWLLRAAQRSPPPALIICIDTSSFCLNPQNVEKRKSHERKQHISRGVSRQQDTRMTAWNALPEAERLAKQKEGIAAWKAWAEKHQSAIIGMGGPLGKTKKVSQRGIEDTSNEMGAYMVVRADSHEAAAELFERHPHFTIFPGESIEIMPVLPIPGA